MSTTRYKRKREIHLLFIKGVTFSIYGLCCFFDLGSFRYVKKAGRLRKHHTSWQWKVLAMCMKLAILILEIPFIMVTIGLVHYSVMGDSSSLTENNIYYWVHLASQMAMATISTLRLLLLTHSSSHSAFFISIVNRVLQMHRMIMKSFGDKYLYSDGSLVWLFLLKILLTLHHIVAQYTPHEKVLINVRYHTVNVILFELFYCSYFLYQLLLLSWQQTLNAFVESYFDLGRNSQYPSSDYSRKLIAVFDIYAEMGDIHYRVSTAWFRVSSMLFISIYYTAHESTYTFYCLSSMPEMPMIDRVRLVISKKLGTCLHPLVAILLMGMASDRLKYFEAQLSKNIFLVELLYKPEDHLLLQKFARLISCKHQSLLLQQQSQPIRNFIWNRGSICDRTLVFEIFVYLIINATTFLQFLISDNNSFCEEGL